MKRINLIEIIQNEDIGSVGIISNRNMRIIQNAINEILSSLELSNRSSINVLSDVEGIVEDDNFKITKSINSSSILLDIESKIENDNMFTKLINILDNSTGVEIKENITLTYTREKINVEFKTANTNIGLLITII